MPSYSLGAVMVDKSVSQCGVPVENIQVPGRLTDQEILLADLIRANQTTID